MCSCFVDVWAEPQCPTAFLVPEHSPHVACSAWTSTGGLLMLCCLQSGLDLPGMCCCTAFHGFSETPGKRFPQLCYSLLINFSAWFFPLGQISDQLLEMPWISPRYICVHPCTHQPWTYIPHIMDVFMALGLESLQYFEPICHPVCPLKINHISCLYFVLPSVFILSLRTQYSALSEFLNLNHVLASVVQLQRATN